MAQPLKKTASAKVERAKLRRVRRFLGARTDSDAIAKALDVVDEQRLLYEFIQQRGGTLLWSDFESYHDR